MDVGHQAPPGRGGDHGQTGRAHGGQPDRPPDPAGGARQLYWRKQMNRSNGIALLVPVAALLLAACNAESPEPQPQPAPAPGAAAEIAPAATEVETTLAQPGVQPGAAASDVRALAGTWSGLLPCADCPGIDETLVLAADGGFVLTDTYRERAGTSNVVQGTWSIEADGQRIRLDPGNKDDID